MNERRDTVARHDTSVPDMSGPESESERSASTLGRLSGRGANRLGRAFANPEPHFPASLEFDDGALGNRHFSSGCARVAPYPRLAHPDLEYAKVAQFHLLPVGQGLADVIKRSLDDIEHLLLYESRIFTDTENQAALCESHRQ